MNKTSYPTLSVVVPIYNEAIGLADFHKNLAKVVQKCAKYSYQIIYCDDGSTDASAAQISKFCKADPFVQLLKLSRNFGKEICISAGIHQATGQAIISIDGDGQHPPDLIPKFLEHWRAGARVVIGIREGNAQEGVIKRWGSKIFYRFFNRLIGVGLIAGSTDFRLIDQTIQREFIRLTERGRITRGLIDWLGFEPAYINFKAKPRLGGRAGYSNRKLFKLAVDSVVSLSLSPLYISAYIGAVVLPLSTLLGLGMVANAALGDPVGLHATGSAYVMVLLLFLVGILLVSQGIIGLYLSHIHTETQNRPLYVIDKAGSIGITDEN